jgi:hypothetical protein
LIEYTRPYLYPKQEQAIFTGKRWALVEASTKSGKTVGAEAWILEGAFGDSYGDNSWWVAPVSDQARIAFTRIKQNLTPGSFQPKETPVPLVQLVNGAIISFRSADKPDSLYGEDVKRVVVDEASRARADAWVAVRSTLTATRGAALIIGNVKGKRNWFWEFARRVEAGKEPNGHFAKITWRDAVAAGVLDEDEIDDARRNLPANAFKELYEAEASDDAGNPFGESHILACVLDGLAPGPAVAFGIDLAKRRDYLVVTGLNEAGNVCEFHRWTGVPWRESIRRIHDIVGEDIPALVDSTGVGDPVLEELQVDHGNFRGYTFSAMSKQRLMEGLAVSIQGHEIGYPDGPIKQELLIFEYVLTRTGVSYSAPEGYNDDCVCSLALARQQLTETQPGASLMAFYNMQVQQARKQEEKEDEGVGTAFLRNLRKQVSPEVLDNELTELYLATLKEHEPEGLLCFRCGTKVLGPSRVTDGTFVWHPGCAGRG